MRIRVNDTKDAKIERIAGRLAELAGQLEKCDSWGEAYSLWFNEIEGSEYENVADEFLSLEDKLFDLTIECELSREEVRKVGFDGVMSRELFLRDCEDSKPELVWTEVRMTCEKIARDREMAVRTYVDMHSLVEFFIANED